MQFWTRKTFTHINITLYIMKLDSEKKMLNTVTRSLLNLKDGDLLTSYLFNYTKNVDDLKVNEFYHGLHFATLSRCQKLV